MRFSVRSMMITVAVVGLEFGLAASPGRWLSTEPASLRETGAFGEFAGLILFAMFNLLGLGLMLI